LSRTIWKTFPLLWKTWGEECIVFNESSGNTHLLNPTAAKILSIVQSQPSSAEEICLKIASESELNADKKILQGIDAVLETLDNLGLIEPE
jgi:PqqD family protein of HPr-rel-A system